MDGRKRKPHRGKPGGVEGEAGGGGAGGEGGEGEGEWLAAALDAVLRGGSHPPICRTKSINAKMVAIELIRSAIITVDCSALPFNWSSID